MPEGRWRREVEAMNKNEAEDDLSAVTEQDKIAP